MILPIFEDHKNPPQACVMLALTGGFLGCKKTSPYLQAKANSFRLVFLA